MKYTRIKENVDGKMVWDYMEALIGEVQWVVTNEDYNPQNVAYRCGSIQHGVFEWMKENLREEVEDKEE